MAAPMPAPFLELPNELLILVLTYVDPQALPNLSTTCRFLHLTVKENRNYLFKDYVTSRFAGEVELVHTPLPSFAPHAGECLRSLTKDEDFCDEYHAKEKAANAKRPDIASLWRTYRTEVTNFFLKACNDQRPTDGQLYQGKTLNEYDHQPSVDRFYRGLDELLLTGRYTFRDKNTFFSPRDLSEFAKLELLHGIQLRLTRLEKLIIKSSLTTFSSATERLFQTDIYPALLLFYRVALETNNSRKLAVIEAACPDVKKTFKILLDALGHVLADHWNLPSWSQIRNYWEGVNGTADTYRTHRYRFVRYLLLHSNDVQVAKWLEADPVEKGDFRLMDGSVAVTSNGEERPTTSSTTNSNQVIITTGATLTAATGGMNHHTSTRTVIGYSHRRGGSVVPVFREEEPWETYNEKLREVFLNGQFGPAAAFRDAFVGDVDWALAVAAST